MMTVHKTRIPTELEIEYNNREQAHQAFIDAKYALSDVEYRLREVILKDPDLANYVMTVSYARLRRWIKGHGG
jgi:hypothetical protein